MRKLTKGLLGGLVLATALVLAVAPARATDISGTISTTKTITDNSRLVGNVTCTVTGAPCIQFGASDISLNLNGFIMTGVGVAMGVDTNSQTNVKINGPGVVRGFTVGLQIKQGAKNKVDGVTVSGAADAGLQLVDTSDNDVEGNTVVGTPPGSTFGILIDGNSNNNRVRHNESIGYFIGVKFAGVMTGNLIEENALLGNSTGIAIQAGATGTLVRRNEVFGNGFSDIDDANAAGANTYQDNLCEVSTGTGAAGVCPNVPSFAGHRNVQ